MGKKEVKVCKICGKEKPVNEFASSGKGFYKTRCKVCSWFLKKDIDYNNTTWKQEEDIFIIDSLLNKKYTINEIAKHLNKDLKELCFRIVKILKVRGTTALPLKWKCENCNKVIDIKPYRILNADNVFCSSKCHNDYQAKYPYRKPSIINKVCPQCNTSFQVTKHEKKRKYCSRKCANKAKENKVIIQCKICGKNITVKKSMAKKTATCSEECASENRHRICKEKSLKHSIIKKCEYCQKEYKVVLSQSEDSRFCSKECYNKWMSEYLVGENNPRFTQQKIKCDYCGKLHYQKLYRLSEQKHFFCSIKCRQNWFAEIYSQTKEWKDKRRKIVVNSLSSGNYSQVVTVPQVILNDLLRKMGIKFENEYNCKYYSIDNYLLEYNLMIECMGTYWHTDNRFYDKINYKSQVEGIRKDKAKNTYIKTYYNIPILYLWEHDLENNLDVCKELILEYINNNGELLNYHSFNYCIYKDTLLLDTNLIIPYMDWDYNKLDSIIDLDVKKEIRKKDKSKWITFDCEYCGKSKEQLISKYNKANHHFCSRSCASSYYYKYRTIDEKGNIVC